MLPSGDGMVADDAAATLRRLPRVGRVGRAVLVLAGLAGPRDHDGGVAESGMEGWARCLLGIAPDIRRHCLPARSIMFAIEA